MTATHQALAQLFRDTAKAHHTAFASTDGRDPEWPLWYAHELKPRFDQLLGSPLTCSEVVALLVELDREHRARAPERPWNEVYAELTAERYIEAPEEQLTLYSLEYCVFCIRVKKVIEELCISVEVRDIWEDATSRQELQEARGRTTVPVLRCESPDGGVRWVPESADIIRQLRQRFGGGAGS